MHSLIQFYRNTVWRFLLLFLMFYRWRNWSQIVRKLEDRFESRWLTPEPILLSTLSMIPCFFYVYILWLSYISDWNQSWSSFEEIFQSRDLLQHSFDGLFRNITFPLDFIFRLQNPLFWRTLFLVNGSKCLFFVLIVSISDHDRKSS